MNPSQLMRISLKQAQDIIANQQAEANKRAAEAAATELRRQAEVAAAAAESKAKEAELLKQETTRLNQAAVTKGLEVQESKRIQEILLAAQQ